jgi:hypothetical protein
MFLLRQFWPAAAVALAVSAVFCAIAIACGKGRLRQTFAALGAAAGYACGHFFVTGWVSFPPADSTNWLPLFALGAAGAGLVLPLVPGAPARAICVGIFAIVAMRLLLQPKFNYGWSSGEGWKWVTGLAVAVALLWWTVGALRRRASIRYETTLLLLMVCVGTCGALSLSGSLLLGQLGAVLAGALAALLTLDWRSIAHSEPFALVFTLLLIALVVCGYFFAELPAASALLLGTAPAFTLLPVPLSTPARRFAARIGLLAASVAISVLVAFRASPSLDY